MLGDTAVVMLSMLQPTSATILAAMSLMSATAQYHAPGTALAAITAPATALAAIAAPATALSLLTATAW